MKDTKSKAITNLKEAISCGADFGLKATCSLSILYTILVTAILVVITEWIIRLTDGLYFLILAPSLFFLLVLAPPLLNSWRNNWSNSECYLTKIQREIDGKKIFLFRNRSWNCDTYNLSYYHCPHNNIYIFKCR
jgi:hypothetical protein